MDTRDLSPDEWAHFFDGFSRRFRGQRMTLRVAAHEGHTDRLLAQRLPLLGIVAEPRDGHKPPDSIEVMLGDTTAENVVHVVHQPTRVRVAQITRGEDEQLIIEAATGETALLEV